MLSWTGWQFRVQPAEVDETPYPGETPSLYVQRLALDKANAARQFVQPGEWVLAADTIVADGVELMGKPQDAADARRMLVQLRAKTHQVYTALAIIPPDKVTPLQDICCADVPMRRYRDDEMDAYIASGDPLDKAGAYAIQHSGFNPVRDLKGCYACIMGMPLCHLTRTLVKAGFPAVVDVPAACQRELEYSCPIFESVMNWQAPYAAQES